ncbi:MAG: RNA 2',3'-cyclic phosphodiesterase [Candidatus Berkelbacteria bacterium]|nr:RNA 2',3'-cyclic phosphodiesterase [Candidatus Berkelbacteria bacterium]
MKKRIFIAINISDNLKKEIKKFRQKYNSLPVRWMPDENLHLTLMPPTEFDDNQIVAIIEKLKELEGVFGPIRIEFQRVTFGPNPIHPRLIWAEGADNPKLAELKNKITQKLGYNQKDKRPFRPHLTLARFRSQDYQIFLQKRLDKEVDWSLTADSFSIIQSELKSDGAVYTKLDEIDL